MPIAHNRTMLRFGGLAALGMATCYISMFILFFGGVITIPPGSDTLTTLGYIQQGYLLIATSYSIGYLLFGVLLAVLLQALKHALPVHTSGLAGLADRFGGIWVVLMMATGMIYLIGLDRAIGLLNTDPEQANAVIQTVWLLGDALGGEIELVGGLWVLLMSIAGLKHQRLPRALHWLGLMIGSVGILTLLHKVSALHAVFGLAQIVWFIWLGVALLCSKPADE